jgi:hypothetical protein
VSVQVLDVREPPQPAGVYEQILGPAWNELPVSIRAVHAPGESRGFMQVSWGDTLPARVLAWALGFPRPCPRLEVILQVQPLAGGDRWVRRMGSVVLASTQRVSSGLLLEAFGVVVCAFRLLPHANGLRYLQQYGAAPSVAAQVALTPAGARTEVEIAAPLIGRVLRYEGIVEPARSDRRP